jgi:hypothetical protein
MFPMRMARRELLVTRPAARIHESASPCGAIGLRASNAALFFGVRTFSMSLGISLANFLFPSLLLLGKDVSNPLGVGMPGVAGVLICITGFVLFSFYDEKSEVAALEEIQGTDVEPGGRQEPDAAEASAAAGGS